MNKFSAFPLQDRRALRVSGIAGATPPVNMEAVDGTTAGAGVRGPSRPRRARTGAGCAARRSSDAMQQMQHGATNGATRKGKRWENQQLRIAGGKLLHARQARAAAFHAASA
jgi:hypothetical protein